MYAEAVLARTVVRVTTFDDNYQRRLRGQPDILEPYYGLTGLDAILRALVPQDPSNAGLIR